MAWTAPATVITGDLLTAALWNAQVRDNMLETAAAKVTTAGDIVYATGANALARLAASANKYPRWNAAGTALVASGRVVGSNTAEQTMTAAAAADLVTISGLSIPVTSGVRIIGVARRSAAAFQPSLGFSINGTTVVEADGTSASIWLPGSTNEAQSGYFVIEFGPRSANYLNGLHVTRIAAGATGTSSITNPRQGILTNPLPNATITTMAIRGLSDGAATLGVKEVFVEQID